MRLTGEDYWAILYLMAALTALPIISVSYLSNRDRDYVVTLQEPFANWGGVARFVNNVPNSPFRLNITDELARVAWCNEPSNRPNAGIRNRSEACACMLSRADAYILSLRQFRSTPTSTLLITTTTAPNTTTQQPQTTSAAVLFDYPAFFPPSPRIDALSCVFKRGVSRQSNTSIRIHPLAIFLTLSTIILIFCLAFVGSRFWPAHPYLTLTSIFAATAYCLSILFVVSAVSNLFFACAVLLAALGTCFALREELPPVTDNGLPTSSPLMACVMWSLPYITMLCTLHLALSVLLRDVAGLILVTSLGFIPGSCVQRMRWSKIFIHPSAQAYGSHVTSGLQHTVGALVVWSLAFCMHIAWLTIFVVVYANWGSPLLSSPVWALLGTLCLSLVGVVELFYVFIPEKSLDALDMGELFLVLVALFMQTTAALVDTQQA